MKRNRELTLIPSRQVEDDGYPTRTRGLEHETIALLEPFAAQTRDWFVNAIADWKGSRAAVWGSSFLFTIMHIQAQPLSGWPSIFLCGMLFALMRVQGVGLPWLILSHAVFDSLVFIGATGESLVPDLMSALFLFRALFVLSYYQTTKPHFEVRAADVPPMNAGLLTWKN